MRIRAGVFAAVSAAAFALMCQVAFAASFSARGSVEQVYATGLKAGAQVELLDAAGKTVATHEASSLGGTLFRDVKPGDGYRVRSGGDESDALTVLSTKPAPPSTDIYNQALPESGYGYLTTRDGTKLAINVHPPQDVSSALP